MFWFALASLTPAALLVGASLEGGLWGAAAIAAITVLVFVMDRLVARLMPDTQDRSGRALSLTLGAAHFGLWGLGLWALGSGALGAGATRTAGYARRRAAGDRAGALFRADQQLQRP